MDIIVSFLTAVTVEVVSYYLIKWLDSGNER